MQKRKLLTLYVAGPCLMLILFVAGLCFFKSRKPVSTIIIKNIEEIEVIPLEKIWEAGEVYNRAHIFVPLREFYKSDITPERCEVFEDHKRKVLDQIDQLIKMCEEGKKPKTTLTLEELKKTREEVAALDSPRWVMDHGFGPMALERRGWTESGRKKNEALDWIPIEEEKQP